MRPPRGERQRLASPGALLALCLALLVAGGAQAGFSGRLWAGGGQPDFVFAVILAAALLSDAGAGCLIGLAGGLITAALVGETVGTILVTRAVAGFVAGLLPSRMFRANAGVVIVTVIAASLVAELLFILSAPRMGFSRWLHAALTGTAWNAALAVPITFLLRRCGWGQGRV